MSDRERAGPGVLAGITTGGPTTTARRNQPESTGNDPFRQPLSSPQNPVGPKPVGEAPLRAWPSVFQRRSSAHGNATAWHFPRRGFPPPARSQHQVTTGFNSHLRRGFARGVRWALEPSCATFVRRFPTTRSRAGQLHHVVILRTDCESLALTAAWCRIKPRHSALSSPRAHGSASPETRAVILAGAS